MRGPISSRLKKLDCSGEYDALVLAAVGLLRLGLEGRIAEELGPEVCLYAVGQGALAVETLANNTDVNKMVECLNNPDTLVACTAEREFTRILGGSTSPIGVHTYLHNNQLEMEGAVFSLDGIEKVGSKIYYALPPNYTSLTYDNYRVVGIAAGQALAEKLIEGGALSVLERAREEIDEKTIALNQKKD